MTGRQNKDLLYHCLNELLKMNIYEKKNCDEYSKKKLLY